MGAAIVLLLAIGDTASPLDRVLPEAVVLRVRMLTLKDGMSQDEVSRRLGLKNRRINRGGGTITHQYVNYPIGETHDLRVIYSLPDGSGNTYGLTRITLTARGRP